MEKFKGDKNMNNLSENISFLAKKILFNKGILNFNVELGNQTAKKDIRDLPLKVLMKIRKNQKTSKYSNSIDIPFVLEQNHIQVNINLNEIFDEYSFDGNLIWDFFIVLSYEGENIEFPLQYNSNLSLNYFTFTQNELYKVKPYVTAHNQLAIYIKAYEIFVNITEFTFEKNNIQLTGYISSKEYNTFKFNDSSCYLILKNRNPRVERDYSNAIVEKEFNILNNYFEVDLEIPEVKTNYNSNIDLIIRLTTLKGNYMDISLIPLLGENIIGMKRLLKVQ